MLLSLRKKIFDGEFGDLLKHAGNFGMGELVLKGFSFITMPIFTHILTTSDFGVVSFFTASLSIVSIIFGLGFHQSITRYYYEENEDFKSFLGTHMVFLTGVIFVFSGLSFIFSNYLSKVFGVEQEIFWLIIICTVGTVFFNISQSLYMVERRSKRYSGNQLISRLVVLLISLFLILFVIDEDKYWGRIIGESTMVIFGAYSYVKLLNRSTLNFNLEHIKYSTRIALPLVPGLLAGVVLVHIDKFFIMSTEGMSDVGIYSFVYTLALAVTIPSAALRASWEPTFFKALNKGEYIQTYGSIKYMTIIQAFISCVLILFAPELIRISAPQSYSVGLVIIPIVVISYFLDYIGSIYTRYIVYEKKRIAILPIYGIVSGVINIGLNMVLIPLYGYKIASVTTLISYLILTILYIQLAYRRMPIEVMAIKEFIKYVIVLVIISLLFYVAYFIDINGVFSIILRFGVSLILFIYFYRIFIDGRKKV